MKKNVASQVIGAQMVNASTGAAFTGSVTVYVTGDGGTQAVGSVGSGACTHEGNGYHTYNPAQAETNYDLCAFTFIGTGAVPVTVQVYTTFPQTGDNYARLGAPAGASVSADIAAVKSETATILTDTNELQTNQGNWLTATGFSTHSAADVWAAATRTLTANTNLNDPTAAAVADAVWDELQSGHVTGGSFGEIATEIASILADTNELQTDWANGGRLDLIVDAILEDTGTTLPASISGLNNLSAAQVNAEVLDVLATDTFAEPASVPAATASLKDKIGWLAALARNKLTSTATTQTLRNDADSASIGTSTHSDDGTTFTRGEWS